MGESSAHMERLWAVRLRRGQDARQRCGRKRGQEGGKETKKKRSGKRKAGRACQALKPFRIMTDH